MARKRMIDPNFWVDDKTGTMEPAAQVLFIGMWNFADDEGLIHYSSAYLRSCIFPHKDLPLADIDRLKGILLEKELVFKYSVSGQDYAWIPNFRNHQVINKPQPSKIPPPSIQNKAYREAIFHRDKYQCYVCGQQTLTSGNDLDADWMSRAPSTDHVIPRSKGGSNYPSNLKTACLSCNKGKKDELPDDYGSSTVILPNQVGLKEGRGGEEKRNNKLITPKGGQRKAPSQEKIKKDSIVNDIFSEMRRYLGYPKDFRGEANSSAAEVSAEEAKKVIDPIPSYGKEGQAIKRMLTRGFTREEILACWKGKVSQRGGEFVSMTWVNEDIGKPQKQRGGARRLSTDEEIAASIKEATTWHGDS